MSLCQVSLALAAAAHHGRNWPAAITGIVLGAIVLVLLILRRRERSRQLRKSGNNPSR